MDAGSGARPTARARPRPTSGETAKRWPLWGGHARTRRLCAMTPEAPLESTETGLVPQGDGWFVRNARDARWYPAEGRGAFCIFEGEPQFSQVGVHLVSLGPGDAM